MVTWTVTVQNSLSFEFQFTGPCACLLIAIIQFNMFPLQWDRPRLSQHVFLQVPFCTLFKWCGTHLLAVLHIFKSCHKTESPVGPESLCANLIPSQSSTFVHPYSFQVWTLTCLCERTQNIHCDVCRHFYMLVHPLPLQTVGYSKVWSPSASYSCTQHFCAFLPWRTAVSTYKCSYSFMEFHSGMMFACEMHVYSCTYTPNLRVTFTCHMLSNACT
jgi:hypothetical protein